MIRVSKKRTKKNILTSSNFFLFPPYPSILFQNILEHKREASRCICWEKKEAKQRDRTQAPKQNKFRIVGVLFFVFFEKGIFWKNVLFKWSVFEKDEMNELEIHSWLDMCPGQKFNWQKKFFENHLCPVLYHSLNSHFFPQITQKNKNKQK